MPDSRLPNERAIRRRMGRIRAFAGHCGPPSLQMTR
jgi:hypothetical protein